MTKLSFDETLIEVWRQALVENSSAVKVGGESYPVRRTPKLGLREVDFTFDGDEIRGLEQNPGTKSRWAQLARSGKKVVPQRRAIRGKRSRWEGDALRHSTVILNRIFLRHSYQVGNLLLAIPHTEDHTGQAWERNHHDGDNSYATPHFARSYLPPLPKE